MVEVLGADRAAGDVVGGPPGTEPGVAEGELADECGELGVVGRLRGLHAERGDGHAGDV